VLGQLGINSMALPPLLRFGSQRLKEKVVRDVVTGRKHISLAISEPGERERSDTDAHRRTQKHRRKHARSHTGRA
jgi:alkylation response protein AidB-like acyl-CoA dehydrogenase